MSFTRISLLFLILSLLREQQALHYELHKNISLQRRVTLTQADQIHDANARIAELEKMLEEAQGISPTTLLLCNLPTCMFAYNLFGF
jgi:hypothetical protein